MPEISFTEKSDPMSESSTENRVPDDPSTLKTVDPDLKISVDPVTVNLLPSKLRFASATAAFEVPSEVRIRLFAALATVENPAPCAPCAPLLPLLPAAPCAPCAPVLPAAPCAPVLPAAPCAPSAP